MDRDEHEQANRRGDDGPDVRRVQQRELDLRNAELARLRDDDGR